ncbi:hypothetical protein PUN28_017122 [Cardiocondyla obscurior]|uniref:Uncharacterized protein n=1 Tax=Cardiocondyla obscurior TaxID=286306 RepID=A0AAW2EKD1_9HYME
MFDKLYVNLHAPCVLTIKSSFKKFPRRSNSSQFYFKFPFNNILLLLNKFLKRILRTGLHYLPRAITHSQIGDQQNSKINQALNSTRPEDIDNTLSLTIKDNWFHLCHAYRIHLQRNRLDTNPIYIILLP